jgi:6-phosphogluconolactonase
MAPAGAMTDGVPTDGVSSRLTLASGAELRIFPDPDRLAAAMARAVADALSAAVGARGAASIALSGGRTPRTLYERLARAHRDAVPWARVHVYWGDERYVPPDDERSNYRMARETLLDHVPVPPAHIHRVPTESADPAATAAAYESTLRTHFGPVGPRFDLILLGLGDDGHTASLFPGSPALDERERWVVAATGSADPRVRVTLTLPAIAHAAAVHFLVTGGSKAQVLRRALVGPPDARACPASAVRPHDGTLIWWADEAAAALARPAAESKGDDA